MMLRSERIAILKYFIIDRLREALLGGRAHWRSNHVGTPRASLDPRSYVDSRHDRTHYRIGRRMHAATVQGSAEMDPSDLALLKFRSFIIPVISIK